MIACACGTKVQTPAQGWSMTFVTLTLHSVDHPIGAKLQLSWHVPCHKKKKQKNAVQGSDAPVTV
jgi:hypothetical protein